MAATQGEEKHGWIQRKEGATLGRSRLIAKVSLDDSFLDQPLAQTHPGQIVVLRHAFQLLVELGNTLFVALLGLPSYFIGQTLLASRFVSLLALGHTVSRRA